MLFLPSRAVKGKPLVDIIGLALHKHTFKELCQSIESNQPLDDLTPIANNELARNHRAKILGEESTKQFSHEYRPLIELIANAADARPADHEGDYFVDITVKRNEVIIQDNGRGMGLEDILTKLLIPFSSDKDAERDIGRFGVGFFSSLGYCTSHPNKVRLKLQTAKDGKEYSLKIGSTSNDVTDILCNIETNTTTNSGTQVHLNFDFKKKDLLNYLNNSLSFFDLARAKFRVNNELINSVPDSDAFYDQVPINFEGIEQNCRVQIEKTEKGGTIGLFSQGVFVNFMGYKGYNIKVDLPSSALLVEGRDEFKQDSNYDQIIEGLVDYFCKNRKRIEQDFDPNFDMKSFLLNFVSASKLSRYKISDVIKENIEYLFDRDTYIVRDFDRLEQYIDLQDFFGEEISSKLYAPGSQEEYYFWIDCLSGVEQLLEDNTESVDTLPEELLETKPALVSISKYIELLARYNNCKLVRLPEPAKTKSPFIDWCNDIYINIDHPLLSDDSFMGKYLMNSYFHRVKIGESTAEDRIIHQLR